MEKVCIVTQIRLGEGGGVGIPWGVVGEAGTGNIYIYIYERSPFRVYLTPSLAYLFNCYWYTYRLHLCTCLVQAQLGQINSGLVRLVWLK